MQPWLTHASNGKGWIRRDAEAFSSSTLVWSTFTSTGAIVKTGRIGVSCDLLIASEGAGSGLGVLAVFGVPDLGQRGLRGAVRTWGAW
jgi:hypothetical protein